MPYGSPPSKRGLLATPYTPMLFALSVGTCPMLIPLVPTPGGQPSGSCPSGQRKTLSLSKKSCPGAEALSMLGALTYFWCISSAAQNHPSGHGFVGSLLPPPLLLESLTIAGGRMPLLALEYMINPVA